MKDQILAEIEFEITEESLSAFNEHHAQYVPRLSKAIERHRLLWPVGIVLLAGYAWHRGGEPFFIAGMLVTALLWSLFVPHVLRDVYRKSVRKHYSEQARKDTCGAHRMQVKESALVEFSPGGRSTIDWKKIMRVDQAAGYAFVYIDTNTALIIPSKPDDESVAAFLGMIRQRVDDSWQ